MTLDEEVEKLYREELWELEQRAEYDREDPLGAIKATITGFAFSAVAIGLLWGAAVLAWGFQQ